MSSAALAEAVVYVAVIVALVATAGSPDLVDAAIYRLTGVKTWESPK